MNTRFLVNCPTTTVKYTNPWPYWKIDNFLPQKYLIPLQEKLCSQTDNFLTQEDDQAKIKYKFLPDIGFANLILSNDFCQYLEEITGKTLTVHEKVLVQLRKMDPNSPAFPIHIDSQEQRSLVCLFYLSPNWRNGCGGELCLFKGNDETNKKQPDQIIEPIANRMILFFADENHWHSVNRVHGWTRYCAISEWIVN